MIHKETLETLQFIFTYTHDKPELHREVATPNMQRFNQLLLQLAQKEILLVSFFFFSCVTGLMFNSIL